MDGARYVPKNTRLSTKYFSGTILGLTCMACRSLETAVPRCSGATVPQCHGAILFYSLSPFHPHFSPPGRSGFPRFARQSAVAPQFLDFRSVSPSGKSPAITHRSCVSSYVPRPTPGPGHQQRNGKEKVKNVFFLLLEKEGQNKGQGKRKR